jgi:ankyrin repeat protein
VFCQLEVLRHCLPSSLRRTLEEPPESLDETYQRLLMRIKRSNRDHARRLLQCLVVAIRPLRVEELAEVLAVDFDDAEGIPKLNPGWRWEDQERALLAACSSLITIVNTNSSRVVQFSHLSVKEFLTSNRLATSLEDVSHYHILLEPAHTILAQACLGVLLQLDACVDKDNSKNRSPLADYAAQHWVNHAQFENVSSHVQKAMEHLFDPDKPHFRHWLRLHDIETFHNAAAFGHFFLLSRPEPNPLYYAAFCGFHYLTEHLIINHPQYLNAHGGKYVTPLVAALARNHYPIAQLLHEHGADVDVRGGKKRTALYSASREGHFEIVQWLLNHGADANARDDKEDTPLHWPVRKGHLVVARILLQNGADAKAQNRIGEAPLHRASSGHVNAVRLLLDHGVDVNARDRVDLIPLHVASRQGNLEVVRLLVERGADLEAKDRDRRTAFQHASEKGHDETAEFLSDCGSK